MIDNRLAEDIQLKLRPDHFFEPLHARIYEQVLKLIDRNMIASPVTMRPLFEADEEMKALGGPGYLAQLTGSGAAVIGARDFRRPDLRARLLRAPDRRRPRDGRKCARHQRGCRSQGPDRTGRIRPLPRR
jgi:replicative DNA helicase